MNFSQKYILIIIAMLIAAGVSGQRVDSLAVDPVREIVPLVDSAALDSARVAVPMVDSVAAESAGRPVSDSLPADSVARAPRKPLLTNPMKSSSMDSMVYIRKTNMFYLYNQGEVTYENPNPNEVMNLKGDRIWLNLETKDVDARGVMMPDSMNKMSRPEFMQGSQKYQMDSLRFNLDNKRGLIYGSTTQQGEGYMIAGKVKMHSDKLFDAEAGKYTTCNHLDHPHFYIAMTRARMIPGKKAIFGRAYFVLEDVPLYFPFVPFGFFPLMTGPSSGFIMPSFGEEYSKGFFLRGAGYYFRLSDYMDAQVTGSIYTLGSWDAQTATRYMKRYKYSGTLSFDYAMNVIGEKGSADYIRSPTYSLKWSHQQDPKFRPGTTFSASVNFTSSGYSKYGATTLGDMLNTQTNSSISYTKSWRPGRGFPGANLSLSFNHSQNSRDSTVVFTFPNASWSVPKFKPLKRREAQGKERWYEKLSLSYSGRMQGSVTTKEKNLFKPEMFDGFKTGVAHSVPVSVAWTLGEIFGIQQLDYINLTPNATYNENWYFKRIDRHWDEGLQEVVSDTVGGFYRAWDYNLSASTSTKIYGMFLMRKTDGWLRAVRHVLTPSASFTYRPDFSMKYRRTYQTNAEGATSTYSPYEGQIYSPPGGAESASISFSLQQNLEAKIRDGDTVRVIKIIDNLNIGSSYNFIAKEFKLANFRVNFSTPIYKNYVLKFDADLDPYALDKDGNRVDRILMSQGKLPRLVRFATSFGWQLNNTFGATETINDTGEPPIMYTDAELEMMDPQNRLLAEQERRRQLSGMYYNFSMPYNLSLNYGFSYNNNGKMRTITQTLGFGGSITLTPYQSDGNNRWGINFQGGYDFEMRKPTIGNIAIVRDLHCFVMSLNWMPIGQQRSWSFNIRVKASVLKDLKYDKRRSMYDNRFE